MAIFTSGLQKNKVLGWPTRTRHPDRPTVLGAHLLLEYRCPNSPATSYRWKTHRPTGRTPGRTTVRTTDWPSRFNLLDEAPHDSTRPNSPNPSSPGPPAHPRQRWRLDITEPAQELACNRQHLTSRFGTISASHRRPWARRRTSSPPTGNRQSTTVRSGTAHRLQRSSPLPSRIPTVHRHHPSPTPPTTPLGTVRRHTALNNTSKHPTNVQYEQDTRS